MPRTISSSNSNNNSRTLTQTPYKRPLKSNPLDRQNASPPALNTRSRLSGSPQSHQFNHHQQLTPGRQKKSQRTITAFLKSPRPTSNPIPISSVTNTPIASTTTIPPYDPMNDSVADIPKTPPQQTGMQIPADDQCPVCQKNLKLFSVNRLAERHVDQCLRRLAGSPVRVWRDDDGDFAEAIAAGIIYEENSNNRRINMGRNSFISNIDSMHSAKRNAKLIGTRYAIVPVTSDMINNGEECPICFDGYSNGDSFALMNCFCRFHKGCIDRWFGCTKQCPVHRD